MGGDITPHEKAYLGSNSASKGCLVDVGQIPDLGPIMVLRRTSQGRPQLNYERARLRIKESDSLKEMLW